MVGRLIETQYRQIIEDILIKEYIALLIFQQHSCMQHKELMSKKEINK